MSWIEYGAYAGIIGGIFYLFLRLGAPLQVGTESQG